MKLYVRTTMDKYELPIAVADSPKELALMLGTSRNVVSSSIGHGKKGWYRIEVDEDEKSDQLSFGICRGVITHVL